MFDLTSAREIASQLGHELKLSAARELREGWFFPNSGAGVGSSGIVANKKSGRSLVLGSAFPMERDLRAYDDGYQRRGDVMRLAVRLCVGTLAFVGAAVAAALAAVMVGLSIGYGSPTAPRWLIRYLVPTLVSVVGTAAAVATWRCTDSRCRSSE